MSKTLEDHDLSPWAPAPTQLPTDWNLFIDKLVKSPFQRYSLKMRFDAQRVGDLLGSWGLPWQVVVAGYLWANNEKLLRNVSLQNSDEVLRHVTQASRYVRAIEHEDLPVLLNPPYDDLGALLIAVAIYYQELKMIQQLGSSRPYTGKRWLHIESIGNTLLNIAKLLGLWRLKREIEDVVEQLRSPQKFVEMQREYESLLKRDAGLLEDIRRLFRASYQQATRKQITIECAACGIVGMRRRLQDAHTTVTSQKARLTGFDLVTFNVAVPTVQECYEAFGVLSQLGYIQDRVTNHLANPKTNGYSHIAFGLILKSQTLSMQEPQRDTSDRCVCQLQIATHLMQAIMEYGCLHPRCYDFYTTIAQRGNIEAPSIEQVWKSEEGKVFLAIQNHLTLSQTKPTTNTPIVVYDQYHRPMTLRRGATALDFAFAVDHTLGEHAVDVIINNRKAPLYRVLDAGDIIEIITARRPQMDEASFEGAGMTTVASQSKEVIDRGTLSLRGESSLRQVLERYQYELTPEELDHELHLLSTRHNLGPPSAYLNRLGQPAMPPPYTADWAAQEIMQQIEEREESLMVSRSRSTWIAVPDVGPTTNKRPFRQLRPCNLCQPTYPRDMKIIGRMRRGKREVIIHKDSCPHLLEHMLGNKPILVPMSWQQQPPPSKVTFTIIAQDRGELILDITRKLRRYTCNLTSVKANIISKLKEAHIRLTLEAYNDKDLLDIRKQLLLIENVMKVEIDPAATPKAIYERLERLQALFTTSSEDNLIDSTKEKMLMPLYPRKYIMDNPFDISRPATGKMFFGRSEEMEKMERELCEGEQGRAFLLYGPRRSGKSSICKNFISYQVRSPAWGVLFSLQNFTRHNEEALFKHLSIAVSREFEEQMHLPAPHWQDYMSDDPEARFHHLLYECIAQAPNKRLILALDEFGGALESYEKGFLAYRFFTYWKELMNEIPQLSLILVLPSSSQRTLSSKDIVNAFSFADSLEVTFLDIESAQKLLVNPLQERNVGIFPSALALAINLTGRNPYYLTLFGQRLINLLNREPHKERITDEDIRIVTDQIIMSRSGQNFDFLAKELLNREELQILEAIVELTKHLGQSKAKLKKIAEWLNIPDHIAKRHLDRLRNGLILLQTGPASNPYYTFTIELVYRWLIHNRNFFQQT